MPPRERKQRVRRITQGDMPPGVSIDDVAAVPRLLGMLKEELENLRTGLFLRLDRIAIRQDDHETRIIALEKAIAK